MLTGSPRRFHINWACTGKLDKVVVLPDIKIYNAGGEKKNQQNKHFYKMYCYYYFICGLNYTLSNFNRNFFF